MISAQAAVVTSRTVRSKLLHRCALPLLQTTRHYSKNRSHWKMRVRLLHCKVDGSSKKLPLRRQDQSICRQQRCNQTQSNDNSASFEKVYDKAVDEGEKRHVSILLDLQLLKGIPLADVRNFCFIAHVDHGKSSLASRVLELVGNLGPESQRTALEHAGVSKNVHDNEQKRDSNIATVRNDDGAQLARLPQQASHTLESLTAAAKESAKKEQIEILDTLAVEKERGITVKASAASMLYRHPSATGPHGVLLLNMVDTPGHADFGTEVTRSLAAVQGAVLLFDAAQGVQAQTLSVYEKAKSMIGASTILPVLTKVDLSTARPLDVSMVVSELFGFDPDNILHTSARLRIGIRELLEAVCRFVPSPKQLLDDDDDYDVKMGVLRAKVVDSWFEPTRGVVCLLQILSGTIVEGDRISVIEPRLQQGHEHSETSAMIHLNEIAKNQYSVQDIGIVLPKRVRTGSLSRGQMGYVVVGLRDPRQAKPGAILVLNKDLPKVLNMDLPKMSKDTAVTTQSALFASVHPMEGEGFDELSAAVDRLALNDSGIEVHKTAGASSNSDGGPFLGPGLRVGFQGLLHVEVFQQRLLDEFGMKAVVTPPKVPYTIKYLSSKSNIRAADAPTTEVIEELSKWPSSGLRCKILEPIVNVSVIAPMEYAGNVMELIKRKRGTDMSSKPVDELNWFFSARMPWGEVVTDFHDQLKNATAGYASFGTSEGDPPLQEADLTKVDIALNGEIVDALAFVCHKDVAQSQARNVCKKLREVLPRQQFVTVIQAKAEGKIVASERIQAFRKDVLTTGGSKSVGGGDVTRKKKLLEKQKKGKKRQQSTGKVVLSQAAFNSVISRAT